MLSIYHPPAPASLRQRRHSGGFVRMFAALTARLDSAMRERSLRATMRELSKLDDRQLEDIGLARGDIETVARRATLGA